MTKTAKAAALVLSMIMLLSVLFTVVINAAETDNDVKLVLASSQSGDTVTVKVKMESGAFTDLAFQFKPSSGVTCTAIKKGDALKDFEEAHGDVGVTFEKGTGRVSLATSPASYSKTGEMFVATFTVPEDADYSIGVDVSLCKTEDSDGSGKANVNVKPITPVAYTTTTSSSTSSSSSSTESTTTSSTTRSTTSRTTRSTKRSTTTRSTTRPTTTKQTSTTTTRVTTIVKPPTTKKQGITVYNAAVTPAVPTVTLPTMADAAAGLTAFDGSLSEDGAAEAEDPIVDVDAETDLGTYDFSYPSETQPLAVNKNFIENSHMQPKVVAVIAAVAIVVLSASVVSVLLIRKKNQADVL